MGPDPLTIELLSDIVRRLDGILLALVDLRVDLARGPSYKEDGPPPRPTAPAFTSEPTVLASGPDTFFSLPLPGKQHLKGKLDAAGNVDPDSLTIVVPSGERYKISREDVEATFGPIRFADPHATPAGGSVHPTDASLNPDAEVSGG